MGSRSSVGTPVKGGACLADPPGVRNRWQWPLRVVGVIGWSDPSSSLVGGSGVAGRTLGGRKPAPFVGILCLHALIFRWSSGAEVGRASPFSARSAGGPENVDGVRQKEEIVSSALLERTETDPA